MGRERAVFLRVGSRLVRLDSCVEACAVLGLSCLSVREGVFFFSVAGVSASVAGEERAFFHFSGAAQDLEFIP